MRLFSLIGSTQFVSPTYLSWMIDSGRCTDCFQIGFSVKKLNEKSTFKQPSEIWYQENNFDISSSQMNHKLLEGCYQSYLIRVWCRISKNFAIRISALDRPRHNFLIWFKAQCFMIKADYSKLLNDTAFYLTKAVFSFTTGSWIDSTRIRG